MCQCAFFDRFASLGNGHPSDGDQSVNAMTRVSRDYLCDRLKQQWLYQISKSNALMQGLDNAKQVLKIVAWIGLSNTMNS